MFNGYVACLLFSLLAAAPTAGTDGTVPENVVMENQFLKVTVSPRGARIVGLIDKVRGGEQVKNLPYVGGVGEVRFNGVINHNDLRSTYTLTLDPDADAGPTLTAVAHAPANDDNPAAATVTKRYTLVKDASRILCDVTIRNEGAEDLAVMPWVRHLLMRGLKEQPQEAHMTPHGAFRSGGRVPGRPDLHPRYDHHHFPAAAWSTRVTMPHSEHSNTLGSILHPGDLLKVFNWHRAKEDFCTQEFIAAPLYMAPGQAQSMAYELVLTAPVQNIVYASPTMVIGATPHPTGIAAEAKQIELTFAAADNLPALNVAAELMIADAPDQVLANTTFVLHEAQTQSVVRQAVPLELLPDTNYQLRLTFNRDGKTWWPGEAVNDCRPVVIPLVVRDPMEPNVVYHSAVEARDRLLQIKPRHLTAPQIAQSDAIRAFAVNPGTRIFSEDHIEHEPDTDATLRASRGEYESIQLIFMPTDAAPQQANVAGGDLVGPGGAHVVCESVNQLLEVKTTIPSKYNASYPVGVYREGLLPARTLPLRGKVNVPLVVTYRVPEDAPAGRYRGSVDLQWDGGTLNVPIEMEVWNITLPRTNPWMDTPASLKGQDTGGVKVRGADGQPLTRDELLDAIVDMHLKYRLTPCDAGITRYLLALNFEKFEPIMQSYVDRGATKIYLGSIPRLLKNHGDHLAQIEAWLKDKGWIDHFYVRPGFDEASPDLIERVAAVCAQWKAVSAIPVMETYYHKEPTALFGKLDIYTRGVSDDPWVKQRMAAGDQFWKVNAFPQYVERDLVITRRHYLQFWDYGFTGSYMWTVKQWHGVTKWYEDFWADGGVGNLSATLIWPHETGLLSSLGLEALRDAIEDNTLFWMLREKLAQVGDRSDLSAEQAQAVTAARDLCEGEKVSKRIDAIDDVMTLRQQAGDALSVLNTLPDPAAD